MLFFIVFGSIQLIKDNNRKLVFERQACALLCSAFTASWTAVIKYHGPRPVARPNHVWVANHSSMIDYIVLCSYSPFAVIMQLHPGWVGFLQTRVLGALGCLWFNRTEVKDRLLVAQRMKEHVQVCVVLVAMATHLDDVCVFVCAPFAHTPCCAAACACCKCMLHTAVLTQSPGSTPLLIFPEGTCVNNEYTVMFKRGAFDLGAHVCPIAIKYNKIFVDAFWNSKRQSFGQHLVRLCAAACVNVDGTGVADTGKAHEQLGAGV